LALAGYGLLGLTGLAPARAASAERWAGPLAGAATGVMAGVTGVFVMPVAPYLQALNLDKDDLIQAMGMAFTVATLALAVMLAVRGEWHAAAAGSSLLALIRPSSACSWAMAARPHAAGRVPPLLLHCAAGAGRPPAVRM
jgi:hypothetical protein